MTDEEAQRWIGVGRALGAARRRKMMSKRQAAASAGISEGTWRQLESGQRQLARGFRIAASPRDETLARAARAVDLDVREVFALAGREYDIETAERIAAEAIHRAGLLPASPQPPGDRRERLPADLDGRLADLTEAELDEVARFVEWVVERRER